MAANRDRLVRERPLGPKERSSVLVLLFLGVVLCGAAVPLSALLRGVVRLGRVQVPAGVERRQPLLVLGGPLQIDGTTASPVVFVGGHAALNGRADDDLVALLGDISLGPHAVAQGNVISLAGQVVPSPGAVLSGSVLGSRLPWSATVSAQQPASLAFVVRRLRLAGLATAALLMLGLAVWTVLPWPALITTATARRYRWRSALLGIGTLVWAPFIVGPLAVNLAGLPLAVLLALALVVLWLVGVVSSAVRLGHRLLRLSGRPHSTLSAALAGLVCLGLLPALPIIGSLTLLLAGCVGLGAALVALWDREVASELAVTQALGAMRFPE